ncbi:MAG: HlyD family efflux transporter periplasmic adaptor subunit [Bdellovibrionota bacterium]
MKKLLFLILACGGRFVLAAPNLDSKTDKPRVLLEEIKSIADKKNIIVPVKVEAKIQSLVSADIEGHVTRILKPLGSTVKKGEVVLYLENKDPGFTYAAVPIRAPFSGVLSQVWISQMSKVIRGDKLFTVINPKSLKLSAEFPSAELAMVHSGIKGRFRMDSEKDLDLEIRLVGLSPLVDVRTGTASAELEFTNIKNNLPPIGSIGRATFEINQGNVILIPEAALVYQEGKPMVRILKGTDQFDKKAIELGEQRDSSFVVKSGIINGDKIVVRSSRPLKEGDTLEVEKPAEKIR